MQYLVEGARGPLPPSPEQASESAVLPLDDPPSEVCRGRPGSPGRQQRLTDGNSLVNSERSCCNSTRRKGGLTASLFGSSELAARLGERTSGGV
jgi:hypothetical protein